MRCCGIMALKRNRTGTHKPENRLISRLGVAFLFGIVSAVLGGFVVSVLSTYCIDLSCDPDLFLPAWLMFVIFMALFGFLRLETSILRIFRLLGSIMVLKD